MQHTTPRGAGSTMSASAGPLAQRMNKNLHSWADTHVAEGSWRKRNGRKTTKKMKPYKYEIIDGTTYFRYRYSDLKNWLTDIRNERARGIDRVGIILVERTGGALTFLEHNHMRITTTWFTAMDGPFPENFDDKALEPPIPLYGHPESPFKNAKIFMPLADEKKVH